MKTLKKTKGYLLIILTMAVLAGCAESEKKEAAGNIDEKVTKTENLTKNTSTTSKGEKKEISLKESKLEWTGSKVTGKHNGTVNISGGELFVDNNQITGGSFEIDFSSITVLDVEDAESNGKLTGHLKSDDFFSAETHPNGRFNIKSVSSAGGNQYKVTGDMIIKGITNEISFPATVVMNDGKVAASGDFNIDRTKWDIKYGSGKFFENLGDKMISDEFNIKFEIKTL
ncbi:MAG: YceI family protein [Ignavibacteria bacterium]|nr:YceI family protein [Ignavibacteria bacterium]